MSAAEPAAGRQPVTITVRGRPAPQGSKRAFAYTPKGGGKPRVSMTEQTSKHLTPWREDVRNACMEARQYGFLPPMLGPLQLDMVFCLARPKSHYRTGQYSYLLRDSAPEWPAKTPDLSKLLRATEDAIVSSGLIADDALIVSYDHLAKIWAGQTVDLGGTLFGLEVPGAVITIRQLDQAATAT